MVTNHVFWSYDLPYRFIYQGYTPVTTQSAAVPMLFFSMELTDGDYLRVPRALQQQRRRQPPPPRPATRARTAATSPLRQEQLTRNKIATSRYQQCTTLGVSQGLGVSRAPASHILGRYSSLVLRNGRERERPRSISDWEIGPRLLVVGWEVPVIS